MRIRSSNQTDCSTKRSDSTSSESRVKNKQKRLDAICDNAFSRKRGSVDEDNGGKDSDYQLRRSGRVRRAPVVLDASPTPSRKRPKRNGGFAGRFENALSGFTSNSNLNDGEELVGWKARLRSTAKNVGVRKENSHGKRKLFEGTDEGEEDSQAKTPYSDCSEDQEEEAETLDGKTSTPIKSMLSCGTVSEVTPRRAENAVISCNFREIGNDMNKVELVVIDDKDNDLHLTVEDEFVNGVDSLGKDSSSQVAAKEAHMVTHSDNHCSPNECVDTDKPNNTQLESVEVVKSLEIDAEGDAVGGVSIDKPVSGKSIVDEEAEFDKTDEKVRDGHVPKTTNMKIALPRKSYVKEGRQCGLCGVGTDGRPPKILARDSADSENEVCSEFSASEETKYDIWDGFGDEPGWLGRLLGPINDRYGITGTWVHQHCAVWSPEVYFAGLGCLKNVRAALCRGRALKCVRCGRRGATIGCRVDRCPKAYHLPCARATGCIFDHKKFLVACAEHRYIYQAQGSQYLRQIRKMKAKKMKLELRKTSIEASRKDFEAEEKWMEKCGEDEEFVKREKKRLQRDLQRLAPVYIGGGATSDTEKPFKGWESVAGLEDVVRCMKEVVILPLLYPEFFTGIGLTPPRGVLLHGYPGTGKTLVVRALIGSCARGDKRIAYFARKGADCLGKYVGDAERQLRLLFQVAERSQPSIIFFDEIDGLAPCRTRKQDQTQSSVVSTLLALMDGLTSRGSVIVIGATNRPDSVDPALRRPGRFDREIYFPLPSTTDRSAILSLQTQNWPKPVAGPLLKLISTKTAGFAGADLQALCTQTAMIALKRHCPLQKILSAAGKGSNNASRAPLPDFVVQERDWLEAISCAPPPCSRRESGMAANDVMYSPLSTHLIPCMLQPLSNLLVSLYLDEHLCLPAPLSRAAKMIESVVVRNLDRENLPSNCWWIEVDRLLQDGDVVQELVQKLSSISEICASSNVITDNSDDTGMFDYLKPEIFRPPGITHINDHITGNKSGFRIMISGSPRVELWASEKCDPELEDNVSDINDQPSEKFIVCNGNQSSLIVQEKKDDPPMHAVCASHLWNSFLEQVDTICISTSLMILSTSEVPYAHLPLRTRQFFAIGEVKWQNLMSSINILPRFVVQVGGKFNHNAVISSAAAKLSRDVVRLFIELNHKRIHSQTIQCESYEQFDSLERKVCTITGSACHQNADDHPDKTQPSEGSRNLPNPIIRNLKGRSNMLLAISTFGYQILWYPHFAELNWVTSKLKDGPSADINGPWKAWPFNSCIVRPCNSSENAVASSPHTVSKRRDDYSLVRGLTAVGLSAYRGLYSSIQEVWVDVRKVLELLVKLISDKIDGGKDKYLFVRLLSQVAYLEDIVINWAHSFSSLESSPCVTSETHELAVLAPNERIATNVDNQHLCEVTGEAVVPVVKSCNASPKVSNHIDLNCEDIDISAHESLVHSDHSGLSDPGVSCRDHVANATNLDKDSMREQYQNDPKFYEPENMVNQTLPNGNVGPLGHSNGFSLPAPDDLSNNFIQSGIHHTAEFKSSGDQSEEGESQQNKQTLPATNVRATGKEGTICLYSCCSKCLSRLHGLMQKLMVRKWQESGGNWTVEDVDDVVRSSSVNLISACSSKYNTEHSVNLFGQMSSSNQNGNKSGCDGAECKSFVPRDCLGCTDDDPSQSLNHSLLIPFTTLPPPPPPPRRSPSLQRPSLSPPCLTSPKPLLRTPRALPEWLAQVASLDDGPIELPSSPDSLFAPSDNPSPLQVATSVLLTGAIGVFLFRSLRRRAKRVKEMQFRSTGAKKSLKEEALESLKAITPATIDPNTPPSPLQALLGGFAAGVIALILYRFTTTIEAALNRQTMPNDFSVQQITITVRTIVNGICYLATFIFGINAVGLLLYSGQLAYNSVMEDFANNNETVADEMLNSRNDEADSDDPPL
ncbi:unnamed protein product [Rhodiola kirilowii]